MSSLTINTNLSSLITQRNLSKSTSSLNTAIERMSTGYKINHARDNAAGYSIATNLNVKMSSYNTASDNIASGMDLVATASDILSLMQSNAEKLMALNIQARNGTYGAQSLAAMNSEASSIISNILMLNNNCSYNNINLLDKISKIIEEKGMPTAGESGFIDETAITGGGVTAKDEYNGFIDNPVTYTDEEIAAMTKVSSVTSYSSGQKYSISTAEELAKLATDVNSGKCLTSSAIFVLTDDIDLSAYQSGTGWTPIGTNSNRFAATFDGNGHVVKNLKIDNPTADCQGLFGYVVSGTIKNVGITDAEVNGQNNVGGLCGYSSSSSSITNCYATGNVSGNQYVGGLCGACSSSSSITNSYAMGNVSGSQYVGGLCGTSTGSSNSITNCYVIGNVSGNGDYVGGLCGTFYTTSSSITNCYATGNVSGEHAVGGLCGNSTGSITNSYATGNVSGSSYNVGGLCGGSTGSITNSYATGNVSGSSYNVGGLCGVSYNSIANSYATGNVSGSQYVGGLCGACSSSSSIANSYAMGNVSGSQYVGGLCGTSTGSSNSITNSYATGNVSGQGFVGGLVGKIAKMSGTLNITSCASFSNRVTGTDLNSTGSFIGGIVDNGNDTVTIADCISSSIDELKLIGGEYNSSSVKIGEAKEEWLKGIQTVDLNTTLQVGINGDSSNQISFNTTLNYGVVNSLKTILQTGIGSDSAYNHIQNFLNELSQKSTELGAIQNRLDSAMESTLVQLENLTSSYSTIKDADVAKVSSEYIKQQILQQASSTLLATANQSPAIALQLI